jgi:hypothetical protein
MNVQLLESLIQVILSLWADEQLALSVKNYQISPTLRPGNSCSLPFPGGYFIFLNEEPAYFYSRIPRSNCLRVKNRRLRKLLNV